MFRKLLSVSGFTLLSRITGFIRDVLMAAILGSGVLMDSFLFAFLFPNYFRQIFGEGAINPAFLPRYTALRAKGEDHAAALFANRIFSWQMAAQALILILALSLMPVLVNVFQAGYPADQRTLIAALTRITFPYLILTVAVIQLSAMLNAIERFWAAAAWSNLWNLSMIVTLLAAHWFPNAAYAAAWGSMLGGVLQLVFMLWAGYRDGLRLRFVGLVWTPDIREFFRAFGLVTFGTASVAVAPLIDFYLASFLPAGSRSALYYADRINQLPLGVLGIALGTVLLPQMSALLAKGETAASSAAQNRSAAMNLLFTLPFMAAFLAIPGIIIRGVFLHGAFNSHAAQQATWALMAYGAGLPAMAMLRIVQATFYARHDTLTPVRSTVIALVSNIVLKIAFVWGMDMGVAGLALGTALGAWINVLILTSTGKSRALLAIEKQFLRSLAPALLAALACGIGGRIGAGLGQMAVQGRYRDMVALATAMAGAGLCYGAVVLLFRKSLPLGRLAR